MARIIDGSSVLAYRGVKPVTPPNMIVPGNPPFSAPRNPTEADINYNLGDFWLNSDTEQLWILVFLGSHLVGSTNTRYATWIEVTGAGTVQFLEGNNGGPVGPDINGIIHTIGDVVSGIVVNGNPGTNTLTWTSSGGGHFGESLTGDTGGAVPFDAAGNIDVIANNAARNAGSTVLIAGNAGTNTLTLNVTDGTGVNSNTIIGKNSGNLVPAGAAACVGLGDSVLQNITGIAAHNTAIGNLAMLSATTARGNVAVGHETLGQLTTGDSNVAVGYNALTAVVTGTDNVAVGNGALLNLTGAASENTAIGDDALAALTAGSTNTALGNDAGSALTTTDSNNTCINHAGIAGSNNKWFFKIPNGDLFFHNYGTANVWIGEGAGNTTTTGAGTNVAVGYHAMHVVTTADASVAIGNLALEDVTSGSGNIAIGTGALRDTTTGGNNVCIGGNAMIANTTGNFNIAIGGGALDSLTTGVSNTIIGTISTESLTTGSRNIVIGQDTGNAYAGAESDNILINNTGTVGESNKIRIGTSGTGAGLQNKCFIAAIRGITTDVNDAVAVLIDSAGQLGTVSSSIRYKENVEDLGLYSNDLYRLRPVRFNYKQHPSIAKSIGLIAEEVMEVYPDLVVKDSHGCPETVKYQDLPVLLLNELQRHQQVIEHLLNRIEDLERALG